MSETSTLISFTGKITRAELAQVPTPPSTASHVPIPHAAVVEALVDTLSHRQISVVDEEFAVSKDGMEMFGVLDLATSFEGCRFAIVIRNANNKRFRLACTVGLRVFVCQNLAFRGDFSPVLAKHSKHLSVEDTPYKEFQRRTVWNLSNAFTSAFKELDPIPQFRGTAKLARFLEGEPAA